MSDHSFDEAVSREILSALADGQAHPDEVSRACQAWRQRPDVRATWHAYHVIGEAMRSPDQVASSDTAAFLQRMRARLADEPVVLSPQALSASAASTRSPAVGSQPAVAASPSVVALKRRVWAGPMAVAASFAAIVGVLAINLGGVGSPPGDVVMARSGVGWVEAPAAGVGLASALNAGGSFSASRAQAHAWQPVDPSLEQVMLVQRPQPNPPHTFADAPGLIRVAGEAVH